MGLGALSGSCEDIAGLSQFLQRGEGSRRTIQQAIEMVPVVVLNQEGSPLEDVLLCLTLVSRRNAEMDVGGGNGHGDQETGCVALST